MIFRLQTTADQGRTSLTVGIAKDSPDLPLIFLTVARSAAPDPLVSFAGPVRARFVDDPHLWASASFDEVVALAYGLSYPSFARQVRAAGLRPWDDATAASAWAGPPLWLHGDLHPANVLTEDGSLCGVVDFGDLCAGDPALDLAACWILLADGESIGHFQIAYRTASDDATWRRARSWAVWRALGGLLIAAADNPGRKPSWGWPAATSLQHLTASLA